MWRVRHGTLASAGIFGASLAPHAGTWLEQGFGMACLGYCLPCVGEVVGVCL